MESKIMILGLGSVGRSLLNLLLAEKVFPAEKILVTDYSEDSLEYFISAGGKKENFIKYEMNSTNYKRVFDLLEEGDFLLCLAERNDSLVLAGESVGRGIHFFSASDDQFDDLYEIKPVMYRDHFLAYKELSGKNKGKATGILQFGMNPGLVSVFTQTALRTVVEKDEGDFVSEKRDYLKKLVAEGKWALLAKELRVSSFIESDFDNTQSDIKEDPDTVYSTWNVSDFDEEMNDRAIIKVGTETPLSEVLKRIGLSTDQVYYYNRSDGTLVLDVPGKSIRTSAFSLGKSFEGCVDAHEEVFSIHDYYTSRNEDGEIGYAPTVIFVYRPCDLALSSVSRGTNTKRQLITKDRMLSGGEAVGICVEGRNFSPVHVETALSCDGQIKESPSILIVSASLYAAIRYAINHPNEGILFPEYTDSEEMISYVSKFMPVTVTRM
jgi:homospermidine synthase